MWAVAGVGLLLIVAWRVRALVRELRAIREADAAEEQAELERWREGRDQLREYLVAEAEARATARREMGKRRRASREAAARLAQQGNRARRAGRRGR